jgi:transcriptional regulator with XRE-family HTH domain
MTIEEQRKIFSENIRALSEASGKKQVDIANDLGISKQTVSGWFNGISNPRMGTVQALADYFGVSKELLLDRQEDASVFENSIGKKEPFSEEARKLMDIITELSDEDLMKLRLYIDFMKQAKEIDEKPKND